MDNTKTLTVVIFILSIMEILQTYVNTNVLDFGDKNTLASGAVALISIIVGYTHHEEKKKALHTPVPKK